MINIYLLLKMNILSGSFPHYDKKMKNTKLTILGGGPIGLTTAILLKIIKSTSEISIFDKISSLSRWHGLYVSSD